MKYLHIKYIHIIMLIAVGSPSIVFGQSASISNILLRPTSSMEKIMPDQIPSDQSSGTPLKISLARGEVEAGQIIIGAPNKPLRNVIFAVSTLKGPRGVVLPARAVELAVVGYVHIDSKVKLAYEGGKGGWFPDPILPFVNRFDVEHGKSQSLWLSIRVPDGQKPGAYKGHVTVSADNEASKVLPVTIYVYDFTIPRKRSLRAQVVTFDGFLKQIHGADWNDALYWKYVDFLHGHRVNMDNSYRLDEPPPTVEQIKRLVAGGQDAWALRFIQQPGQGFSDVGVAPLQYKEYLAKAIAEAKVTYLVLKEAGAENLAYFYLFDEVRENHWPTLRETAQQLRKEFPGVPIITSAFDREYGATSGLDEVVDIWVGIIAHFKTPKDRAKADLARAKGSKVVWYTTAWPPRPYPNFFIEYDAIEPRILMGAMTQKYKPDGFGYWAVNWWFRSKDQTILTEGPYTKWNPYVELTHGEGSWIYAGKQGPITSIRFENFRDGLEDYEYYKLLEKAVLQAEIRGVPKDELTSARVLLAVPDEVVREVTDFVRNPGVLAQHREEVARAIERLAKYQR